MKPSKIAIIGAGIVGSTTAYALMLRNIAAKILLVDINQTRCKGEMFDLSDALPFSTTSQVSVGTIQDAQDADIIIITAGTAQQPGQSRIDLMHTNHNIIHAIIMQLIPLPSHAIIIMVTNPVDIMTYVAHSLSGLPHGQVFGSGTLLDTQRLRTLVSNHVNIAQESIHLYVLGEHGDSQFVPWSCARIGGMPLTQFRGLDYTQLEAYAREAQQKVYDIIACKGSTAFGIAACVSIYCQNIIFDAKRVTPISCYHESFNVYMSMPAVLGKRGIEQILYPPLDAHETEQQKKTIHILQQYIKEIYHSEG